MHKNTKNRLRKRGIINRNGWMFPVYCGVLAVIICRAIQAYLTILNKSGVGR